MTTLYLIAMTVSGTLTGNSVNPLVAFGGTAGGPRALIVLWGATAGGLRYEAPSVQQEPLKVAGTIIGNGGR